MKKISAILACLFIALHAFSQGPANMWYFGNKAGLDFTGGSPNPLFNSAMFAIEGCTSISDNNGSLLFYTVGDTVWNKNHQMMPNGFGLFGHNNSTQSALVVPKPGNPNVYYIFTTGAQCGFIGGYAGLSYSIVDMTLQAGLGDVTVKNTLLVDSTCEKLSAVLQCNGTDYWIMAHKFGNNAFYCYPLTAAGVGAPVITNIGPFLGTGFGNAQCLGQMKFSPNGRKLAEVTYAFQVTSVLLDFDPSTGILSNPVNLPMNGYGVEFSPDGTKLYFAAQKISTVNWGIYQFDLCAPNIPNSIVYIANNVQKDQESLQLGPDKKIYVARHYSSGSNLFLGVINNPNTAGTGCNYVDNGLNLGGRDSWFGLPGFVTSLFYQKPTVTYTSACVYDPVNFTIACNTDVIDSVRWNFDDPSTGANNTSTVVNASHIFSAGGTYNVQVIVHFECRTDTVITPVTLTAVNVTVTSGSSVCPGTQVPLTAGGANTYAWSPSSTLSSSTGSSVIASPTATTTYSVIGTDASGCVDTNTVTITMVPAPTASISGSSTICSGSNVTLTASGGTTYSWNTSSTSTAITVTPTATTTYTVTASNGVCTDTASFTVTVITTPVASINGSATICTNTSTTLTASGGGNYSWSTGGTSSSVTVSPSTTTTYSVVVNAGNCSDTAFFTVTVVPPPVAQVTGTDSICSGSPVTLTASGGATYSWNTGETTSSIVVSPVNTNSYYVIASNGTCSDTAFFTVNTFTGPTANAGTDITFNIGNQATLNGSGGVSYVWSPATDLSCTTCANPVASPTVTTTYVLTVTDANGCTDTDTMTIYVTMNCDAEEGDVFIPDAFSPNGDGVNEVLYVRGGGMKSIEFSVYDRWGIKVFESTDQQVGWDGTYLDKKLNPGVYVYVLKTICYSGESFMFKGNITLLR